MQFILWDLFLRGPDISFLRDGREEATGPSLDKGLPQNIKIWVFSYYFNFIYFALFSSQNIDILLI